jgi:hypothetical protein
MQLGGVPKQLGTIAVAQKLTFSQLSEQCGENSSHGNAPFPLTRNGFSIAQKCAADRRGFRLTIMF